MSTEYDFLDFARRLTAETAKMHASDPTLAERLDRDPELLNLHAKRLCERVGPIRQYDLSYEYTSFAPFSERWTCVDLCTFDGASEGGVSACVGRGPDRDVARQDLLDQFADLAVKAATPKAKASTPVYRGSEEPDDFGRDEGDLFDETQE